MAAADNFLQPVIAGIARLLEDFRTQMVPLTVPMSEWQERPQREAMGIAPGRMVDEAEKLLSKWLRKEATPGAHSPSTKLPAMIMAIAHDYMPTARDFTRQVSEPVFVRLSDDDNRVFKLRTLATDERVQVAVAAHDITTVKAIISQLEMFLENNRRFGAEYQFAGHRIVWPVTLETPEIPASNVPLGDNLALMTFDLSIKTTIPVYSAPGEGEPNDGSPLAPPGYPVVTGVAVNGEEGLV
ncbi:MAG: hypothetical protein CMN80_03395 [Spongiibacter sp.]|uniref:hypothetical protein n=1 Tax=Spongiibacter sp. TaxID=2024860 RepID=UPI000C08E186|nr:hypothetical protein [Spongiibacter sp.]MAK43185.1 hypothetical protein [Spongiibacter sp.]